MILISACLLGINCQYNEENDLSEEVLEFLKDKRGFIAVCPECLGGLAIPRDPSEIIGGKGEDVIEDKAKVKTIKGKDVTKQFLKGAEKALKIAQQNNIKLAILKSRSPSCGVDQTCDGTFSGRLIKMDIKNHIWLRKREKSGEKPLF